MSVRTRALAGLVALTLVGVSLGLAEPGRAEPMTVSVKDFGAKGDGSSDDAPAIQRAIDRVAATGGTVLVPRGVYLLRSSAGTVGTYPDGSPVRSALILRGQGTVVRGEGAGSVLKLGPRAKMRVVSVTGVAVTIEQLAADGNKGQRDGSKPYPGGDATNALIAGHEASLVTVRDCTVYGGIEDGIGFWRSDDVRVERCNVHDNGTAAAGGAGIALSGGRRGIAIANVVRRNTAAGIWAAFDSANTTIKDNLVEESTKAGISIEGSGFTITGNTVRRNGAGQSPALNVVQSTDGLVEGNSFDDNANDGMVIDGGSARWTVTSNSCSNGGVARTQDGGIRVAAGASAVTLRSNTCRNNGTDLADQIVVADGASVNADWRQGNVRTFEDGPTTARIAGADRYATAAALSAASSASSTVAYLASGELFPDGLAVGPVAVAASAPLLLTQPTQLPDATRGEIRRLGVRRVVIVGGERAVASTVEDALRSMGVEQVSRIAGIDRYATAAALNASSGRSGGTVYIASGETFPDALAAGAVAGTTAASLLLTRREQLPDSTRAELARMKPARAVVVGGSAAISAAVEAALGSFASSVQRIGGGDRDATAAALSAKASTTGSRAYLVSGRTFADALSAGVAASRARGALLVNTPACLVAAVEAELDRIEPPSVTSVGGTQAVPADVAALVPCWLTRGGG